MKKLVSMLIMSIVILSIAAPVYASQDPKNRLSVRVGLFVGIQADGRVTAAGSDEFGQCNTSDWVNVTKVSASYDHTLGLTSAGTVMATGNNQLGQCNTSVWENIIDIVAGADFNLGLQNDGSVVFCGAISPREKKIITGWKNLSSISAPWNIWGITNDNKVLTTSEEDVSNLTDVVQILETDEEVYYLTKDGVLIYQEDGICKEFNYNNEWDNIVQVSTYYGYIIGQKKTGLWFQHLH